jgi:hypothetical protein
MKTATIQGGGSLRVWRFHYTRPMEEAAETTNTVPEWRVKRRGERKSPLVEGDPLIQNDQELAGTQERIAYFQRLLAQLRVTATPEEFAYVASGYRAEIERMQAAVLDYLTRHPGVPTPAQAV